MAMLGETAGSTRSAINITPLIDVLLVLLVIFMVSVTVRQVLDAQLAREVQAGGKSLEHPIVLELRADGAYAVNQQVVSRQELQRYLAHVYWGRAQSILFVKANSSRRFGEMIDAVDVARGAGVQVIALAP